MKILIDTNIVIDVLLKREPFYRMSVEVLELAKREEIQETIKMLRYQYGLQRSYWNDYRKSESNL